MNPSIKEPGSPISLGIPKGNGSYNTNGLRYARVTGITELMDMGYQNFTTLSAPVKTLGSLVFPL